MIAIDYVHAGISIIPLSCDGTKSPSIPSWNPYRKRFATDAELETWFSPLRRRRLGIGLVCGVLSDGLEVLDFDEDADCTFHAWIDLLPNSIRGLLCVCETGGLGYHVVYRCDEVCGNSKIAMLASGETRIESRGEGGYIVGVGSPLEVHSSGSPYVQVMGLPLPEVPRFTAEERKIMWRAAASLDERPDPRAAYVEKVAKRLRPVTRQESDPESPWEDFNQRATWYDVLAPAGWSTSDGAKWTRPGKDFGCSAAIATAADGVSILTVFSGNAGPLAPTGVAHRNWSKFGAYAAINHNCDRSAAAKALTVLGFGKSSRRASS